MRFFQESESSDVGLDLDHGTSIQLQGDKSVQRTSPPAVQATAGLLTVKTNFIFQHWFSSFSLTFQIVREGAAKQLDELYTNDRLPETVVCLYSGITQSQVKQILFLFRWFANRFRRFLFIQVTPAKLKENNISVITFSSLADTKAVLNNLIQRIQKK